ncbi:MAG: NTP transferase domain-containing protein [Planctomycetota bacterium]
MAVLLAAGKGTRMKSELPKVLVPVCGRPMLRYVVDALRDAGVRRMIVVVGHRADLVRAELSGEPGIEFTEQSEQLGTGHAVMMCRSQLREHRGSVVVVAGDSPLLQTRSLRTLLAARADTQAACLLGTVMKEDPTGLGRIVRDQQGRFAGIVEDKDATEEQRKIREINVSTYVFDAQYLLSSLDELKDENAQGEYYITDCPGILLALGLRVDAVNALQPCEALSINSMDDLREVEREMRRLGVTSAGRAASS